MSVADDTAGASNAPFSRDKFESELKSLGSDYGAGHNSRPAAFIRAIEAASTLTDVGPDDAKDLWAIFQKSAARKKGLEYAVEASSDQQVSKFRTGLKMGALPGLDAYGTIMRAVDIIAQEQPKEDSMVKGSMYDNMVNIARAQIAAPEHDLTDEEIRSTVLKTAEDKTELDKLTDLYKRAHKIVSDLPVNSAAAPYGAEAVASIGEAIKSLDGDLPPVTKQGRAQAALIKRAAKVGLFIVPAPVALIRDGEIVEEAA